jgi:hypothetical protein
MARRAKYFTAADRCVACQEQQKAYAGSNRYVLSSVLKCRCIYLCSPSAVGVVDHGQHKITMLTQRERAVNSPWSHHHLCCNHPSLPTSVDWPTYRCLTRTYSMRQFGIPMPWMSQKSPSGTMIHHTNNPSLQTMKTKQVTQGMSGMWPWGVECT